MQTIESNGPAPLKRQASARESRWNWSQDTGKIFVGSTGRSDSEAVMADRLAAPAMSSAKLYSALIQSITCRRATRAVVKCPAKTSTYWVFGFLASALKAYWGRDGRSGRACRQPRAAAQAQARRP